MSDEKGRARYVEGQWYVPVADYHELREALLTWAANVERDRREPDKVLCAVQSMRRVADRA